MATPAQAPPVGSISFVVTARRYNDFVVPLLKLVAAARRPDDEVIFLIGEDHPETATYRPDWLRIVEIPDASIYRLRAHIPTVCRREWVILFEDHIMIEPTMIDEMRNMMREQPGLDLITLGAKNLTSTGRWDWAIFLFNFALVWAPLDRPPPFALVTTTIVRRARLGAAAPLKDGEWELRTIAGIFRDGNKTWSKSLSIDHIKRKTLGEALVNIFQNARSGAALQIALGDRPRRVLHEGWSVFTSRPGKMQRLLSPRRHELPPGTFVRLRVLSFMHMIGFIAAVLFGGGGAAQYLDYD